MIAEHLAEGPDRISVRHDCPGRDPAYALELDAGDASVLDDDALHLGVAYDLAAAALDRQRERVDQPLEAALDVRGAVDHVAEEHLAVREERQLRGGQPEVEANRPA